MRRFRRKFRRNGGSVESEYNGILKEEQEENISFTHRSLPSLLDDP